MPPGKGNKKRRTFPNIYPPDCTRRVHIVFNCQEESRITHSIFEEHPDCIYYLQHKFDKYLDFKEKNLKEIKEKLPTCEIVNPIVDYVDYFALISKIFDIFTQEKKNGTWIVINAGTGSKLVAVAILDAYRIWPDQISLIYPYSDDYNPGRNGPSHFGAMRAAHPPKFKMLIPDEKLIIIIQILYRLCVIDANSRIKKGHVQKSEFEDFLKNNQLIKKPLEITRILGELEKTWKYITVTDHDIYFTRAGKQIALIFRFFHRSKFLDQIENFEQQTKNVTSSVEIKEFGSEPGSEGKLGDFLEISLKDESKNPPIRKVHICYNCKETDRLTQSILDNPPDRLYYFIHKSPQRTDINLDMKQKNLTLIKEKIPKCEIFEPEVNYVDYYDVLSKLDKIVNDEKVLPGVEITINLATGSKMVAMANLDMFRLYPDLIKCIYPYTRDYDTHRPDNRPFHEGPLLYAIIPLFKFEIPDIPLVLAMQILEQQMRPKPGERAHNEVKQEIWVKKLVDHGILYSDAKTQRERDIAYRNQLKNQIRKPLEEQWKFIRVMEKGRSALIRFTEEGNNFINAFRYIDKGLRSN